MMYSVFSRHATTPFSPAPMCLVQLFSMRPTLPAFRKTRKYVYCSKTRSKTRRSFLAPVRNRNHPCCSDSEGNLTLFPNVASRGHRISPMTAIVFAQFSRYGVKYNLLSSHIHGFSLQIWVLPVLESPLICHAPGHLFASFLSSALLLVPGVLLPPFCIMARSSGLLRLY